jgi:lantibiotic modifying enzyme
MGTLINASIDLTKVDKTKLVKGKYLNLTIAVYDNLDNYGNNVSLTIQQSKEERDLKASKTYLGNGKVVYTNGDVKVAEKQDKPLQNTSDKFKDIPDLPF